MRERRPPLGPVVDRASRPAVHLPSSRPLRLWLAAFGAWSVPAVADTLAYVVAFADRGTPIGLAEAAARAFPKWYFLALLTPPVWLLADRFRFERGRLARAAAVHVPAAALLGALHISMTALYRHLAWPTPGDTALSALRWYFVNAYYIHFFAYWEIVGAYYAVRFHQLYRDRELAAARLEADLVRAQLDALRLQLHPHFLFNTLNAVVGLLREGDRDRAVAVVNRLGVLLRRMLDGRADEHCSLEEELDFVEQYLEVEQVRLGDRLAFGFEVAPETLAADVPRYLLQPLVENAVRHGVARRSTAGRVVVSSRREGGRLRLEVRDDGAGPGAAPAAGGTGIGLANIRDRLRTLYGDDGYRLSLAADPERGTRATIEIPFRAARPGPSASVPGAPA